MLFDGLPKRRFLAAISSFIFDVCGKHIFLLLTPIFFHFSLFSVHFQFKQSALDADLEMKTGDEVSVGKELAFQAITVNKKGPGLTAIAANNNSNYLIQTCLFHVIVI